MVTLVTIVHVLIGLLLILVTFFQDSQSGSLGGAFGGGQQSVFGPIGATTVLQKITWWLAGLFALTSLVLAYMASRSNKSILDALPPQVGVEATAPAPSEGTTPANPNQSDAPAAAPSPASPAENVTEPSKASGQ